MATLHFNCDKAFNKLKGRYRLIVTKDSAVIRVLESTHTNPQGSQISMTELARILIFGNEHIPSRSFFEDFSEDKKDWLLTKIKENIKTRKVKSNSPFYIADIYIELDTDTLAKQTESQLKQWLLDGTFYKAHVPNALSTIDKKGNDVPLYETGQLIRSIFGQTKVGK